MSEPSAPGSTSQDGGVAEPVHVTETSLATPVQVGAVISSTVTGVLTHPAGHPATVNSSAKTQSGVDAGVSVHPAGHMRVPFASGSENTHAGCTDVAFPVHVAGQRCWLHGCTSVVALPTGHSAPLSLAARATKYVRLCSPPPHRALHSLQADQFPMHGVLSSDTQPSGQTAATGSQTGVIGKAVPEQLAGAYGVASILRQPSGHASEPSAGSSQVGTIGVATPLQLGADTPPRSERRLPSDARAVAPNLEICIVHCCSLAAITHERPLRGSRGGESAIAAASAAAAGPLWLRLIGSHALARTRGLGHHLHCPCLRRHFPY